MQKKKKKEIECFFFLFARSGFTREVFTKNTGAIKLLRAMKIFQPFPPIFLRSKITMI